MGEWILVVTPSESGVFVEIYKQLNMARRGAVAGCKTGWSWSGVIGAQYPPFELRQGGKRKSFSFTAVCQLCSRLPADLV